MAAKLLASLTAWAMGSTQPTRASACNHHHQTPIAEASMEAESFSMKGVLLVSASTDDADARMHERRERREASGGCGGAYAQRM